MIDPAKVCLFIPPELRKFKLDLFQRIGRHIKGFGGSVIHGDHAAVARLPDEIVPIIGCTPPFRPFIADWRARGRRWIYWDRGYARRVFATWLPRGANGGYYRWHVNAFQMQAVRDVPADRWNALDIAVSPWHRGGAHIVVADTGFDYWDLHADRDWTRRTVDELRRHTDRKIVVRDKESKVPLDQELAGAHCLVTHGSIAAVEAVVMGCPVFVHRDSAAAVMGRTDFTQIEAPVYPDRERWLHSLAYCQFNEAELCDGTLWRLIA